MLQYEYNIVSALVLRCHVLRGNLMNISTEDIMVVYDAMIFCVTQAHVLAEKIVLELDACLKKKWKVKTSFPREGFVFVSL